MRTYLRSKQIYLILREYHQQVIDDFGCDRICSKLIQILIGDEDVQVESDNLLELNIPTHLKEKFEEIDRKEEQEKKETEKIGVLQ